MEGRIGPTVVGVASILGFGGYTAATEFSVDPLAMTGVGVGVILALMVLDRAVQLVKSVRNGGGKGGSSPDRHHSACSMEVERQLHALHSNQSIMMERMTASKEVLTDIADTLGDILSELRRQR